MTCLLQAAPPTSFPSQAPRFVSASADLYCPLAPLLLDPASPENLIQPLRRSLPWPQHIARQRSRRSQASDVCGKDSLLKVRNRSLPPGKSTRATLLQVSSTRNCESWTPIMSADTQINMSSLSPALHLDLPFMYGPPVQSHAEATSSSDITTPVMASVSEPTRGRFHSELS